MTESSKEQRQLFANADFIISEDSIARELLSEIYLNLRQKPIDQLSSSENTWLSRIEGHYNTIKSSISNQADWLFKVGSEISKVDKEMTNSFQRVLDASTKSNALKTFFTEFENSVESLFRLDYTQKNQISTFLDGVNNDFLNYIVMIIEMIRERLGQAVVSRKVVRSIMSNVSDVGVLVTDQHGRIRFANEKMDKLLSKSGDDWKEISINDIVSQENTLLNASEEVKTDHIEIQQIKVPSVNGEMDEWIYAFSSKVDQTISIDQMAEFRKIIDQISKCSRSESDEMKQLLEVLNVKFSKIEKVSIPATGLLKSGLNIRSIIDESLLKEKLEDEEIEVIVDAKENIHYFGDDRELKIIVDQMLTCALRNLAKSPRSSKLEIVVSSFQHYLLFAFMDNGAISTNYTLMNEMRENVKKMQGSLELNSGSLGNNLSVIIPI